MGTRADFYMLGMDGDEEILTWLGSIPYDGYPDGSPIRIIQATTQEKYIELIGEFSIENPEFISPSDGWNWPWEDSNTTDYAYCYLHGKVWANYFGHGWFLATAEPPDFPDFPKMPVQKQINSKSGIMIISVKKDQE